MAFFIKKYTVGTQIELTGAFYSELVRPKVLADPTVVTMRITQPDKSIIDLSSGVNRTGVGLYNTTFTPTMVGTHLYEFIGTGNVIAAGVKSFIVNANTF